MHPTRPWTRLAIALLGAAALASPATSQERSEEREALERKVEGFLVRQADNRATRQDDRNVEEIIGLIQRLEVGLGALEELGARDTMRQVAEIVQRLRNSRDGVRRYFQEREERGRERESGANDLDDLEFRVGILQHARHAYAEVGNEKLVEYLDRVLRVAQLQAQGAGEEQLTQAMEGISMGNVVELLVKASRIWAEFGHEGKAGLCAELAEYYAARNSEESAESEREPERSGNLEELGNRLDVVRWARGAHAEAGRQEAAQYLERWLHLGELTLEGAGDDKIAAASEGLSVETTVELLRHAAELYADWGNQARARGCLSLAEFYVRRDGLGGEQERAGESEREGGHGHGLAGPEQRGNRLEIVQLALRAQAEAGNEKAVGLLERFLHFGHLQLEGASDEQLSEAAQGLSMESAIKVIQQAAELYADWGNEDRAHLCASLAEYYLNPNQGEGGEEQEVEEHDQLEDERAGREGQVEGAEREALARRVKIIALAHDAHAEAGHPDRADLLERAAHIGHLVLEGAGAEQLAQASEGFSTEALIGPLRSAAELYQEWGMAERAHACAELAEYYRARNSGGEEGERDVPRAEREERPSRETQEGQSAERREMAMRHLEQLHQRMNHLQEQLAELRGALEEVTRALRR